MEGDPTLLSWSQQNFGGAELGDKRLTRRLVQVAGAIRQNVSASLPCIMMGVGAALAATYRLLSNDRVDPQAMQMTHRMLVADLCSTMQVILCVQDSTQLDFSKRAARGSIDGVGPLGRKGGGGQGLIQHAALAITAAGKVLGVLDQQIYCPQRPPEGETRAKRRLRDTAAECWTKAAKAVSKLAFGACRVIHVGDRHSDMFSFFVAVREIGHGFLVRAMHDRYVALDDENDDENSNENQAWDAQPIRLIDGLESQPCAGEMTVNVPARSGPPKERREARTATLQLRFTALTLQPPRGDTRFSHEKGVKAWAVLASEPPRPGAPAGAEPIRWTLLTSEPVHALADAQRMVQWYSRRWVIEEWHKALKQGCHIEKSQLDHADDIRRLAAILGPVAADMLALRDLVDNPETADDPQALQRSTWDALIAVVAILAGIHASKVTPRILWQTMARHGGHLFRKNDPRPGWQALWTGYRHLALLAQGYTLAKEAEDV